MSRDIGVLTIRCKISVLHRIASSRKQDQWRFQLIKESRRALLLTELTGRPEPSRATAAAWLLLCTERCVRYGDPQPNPSPTHKSSAWGRVTRMWVNLIGSGESTPAWGAAAELIAWSVGRQAEFGQISSSRAEHGKSPSHEAHTAAPPGGNGQSTTSWRPSHICLSWARLRAKWPMSQASPSRTSLVCCRAGETRPSTSFVRTIRYEISRMPWSPFNDGPTSFPLP